MAESNTHKGKLILLLFLVFIFASDTILVNSSQGHDDDGHEVEQDHAVYQEPLAVTRNELAEQKVLLNKLEELVKNLSEIVARLEPKIVESPKLSVLSLKTSEENDGEGGRSDGGGEALGGEIEEKERFERRSGDRERGKAISVTKYSPLWSERFQFVSAVKLDSTATCITVMPFRDHEGQSKYVAVGDDRGRVYVLLRNGDVGIEFYTNSESPITAMVSYLSAFKNESVLVTGHKNGAIFVHKVYDVLNGEELSSLYMDNVGKFAHPVNEEHGSAISILEVHHVGRLKYILSTDDSGMITVFKENGTIHGSAMPTSKPLAFLKQRLLFLTESGSGSLDLRSMKIRESDCEGLNHSLARNYVFDSTERSKAYGFTSDGDLIHVLLLGDIVNFKCRVRSKRKSDMDEPLALQVMKGYLLVVNEEKVFIYNISSHHFVRAGGPRLLFSTGLDDIRSSFMNYQVRDKHVESRKAIPLIACDREKLVVLGLKDGYVGMYRSNLPVHKGEFNTMLWTSPVLFFLIFLFAAWHFFAKKKEELTSWGPDDFTSTSVTAGAPIGTTTADRSSFTDPPSRSADIMELRPGGLRGPPNRRYGSPPGYSRNATGSFRPSASDASTRPTPVDPNYRPSADLKYRGSSSLETTGFPKRREPLFSNNQVGDDNN